AILDPLDRTTGIDREQRHDDLFGIQAELVAEAATDSFRANPDEAFGHAKRGRQLTARQVRRLSRRNDIQRPRAAVVAGHHAACLDRQAENPAELKAIALDYGGASDHAVRIELVHLVVG